MKDTVVETLNLQYSTDSLSLVSHNEDPLSTSVSRNKNIWVPQFSPLSKERKACHSKHVFDNMDDNPSFQHLLEDSIPNEAQKRVVYLPNSKMSQNKDVFTELQSWEGYILEIRENSFVARISDLTSKKNPDEEVEIERDDIPESDLHLLAEGAIFYWYIGYLDQKSGTRLRASIIRLRRVPVWNRKEWRQAQIEADKLIKMFGWDEESRGKNSQSVNNTSKVG